MPTYLQKYIHMYIPTYSWMSAQINMNVNTYKHTSGMFAYIHTNIVTSYISRMEWKVFILA